MNQEKRYIQKRIWKARLQSLAFYICRIFPIHKKKIVFCCIEGTTGYTCNPKYIAEELIRQNEGYELIWLVNDISKSFPKEVKAVCNTLWNRAYHLSTARFWIDNSRKQLEVRKRKGQIYIQTWHAKLGFKPTCLDRGVSFSEIAYLVSKHDSDMVDYWLSNSDWYDKSLSNGALYEGCTLRTGSPRCDILVKDKDEIRKRLRMDYKLPLDAKILMYAPTFRGGNQDTKRTVVAGQDFPNYQRLLEALEKRFTGKWYIFLRLHPQLVARNVDKHMKKNVGVEKGADLLYERLVDVSRVDDLYEMLAGCDGFMTDYSSAAFDALVMKIPIFLYAKDYEEYERERGKLLWDLRSLPFLLALNDDELEEQIIRFDEEVYLEEIRRLLRKVKMVEDGMAAERVVKVLKDMM